MTKKWQLKKEAPKNFIEQFPEFSPIVLQLLYSRGITEEKEIEQFLNPDWERDLYDPFLMKGAKEAVARTTKALKKKEKIAIFGHFDVDGISSSALLYLAFKKIGLTPAVYIPSRQEGFGLSQEAIKQLLKEKTDLIITADCGISSVKEIDLASRLKIDVLVTDHHEVPKVLPRARAILNPKQKGCKYPFKELAGAGVVFKFIQALSQSFPSPLSHSFIKWLADIVALGTICDVVPLISENRLLAKFGLIVLNKTKRVGLLKLYDKANVEMGKIDPFIVSYLIGPRLNAPGRMDHANASFYLLTTKDEKKAHDLAKNLDDFNRKRQVLLDKILEEAKKEIEDKRLHHKKLILLGKKEWPPGIVGLLAGKLKDLYSRPVIAATLGEEQTKASGRSIDSFHLVDALSECEEYLLKFGGHKKAAGFTVYTSKLEGLKNKLVKLAEERLTEEDVTPTIEIEAKIPLSEVNWNFYEQLSKFGPEGPSNPRPLFLAEKVRLENIKTVGNDKHLKLKLYGMEAIYFGAGGLASSLWPGDIIDIVFQIIVDQWHNERKLNLKIVDLKKARTHH